MIIVVTKINYKYLMFNDITFSIQLCLHPWVNFTFSLYLDNTNIFLLKADKTEELLNANFSQVQLAVMGFGIILKTRTVAISRDINCDIVSLLLEYYLNLAFSYSVEM